MLSGRENPTRRRLLQVGVRNNSANLSERQNESETPLIQFQEHIQERPRIVKDERLVEYEREDWPQLQLAYAITSHRAQGSEWDNVVVVVSQSHYMMLQRNLLYTALTRARNRAVLIVSGGLENKQTGRMFKTALEVAVANDKIARRNSGLAERLSRLLTEQQRAPVD